MIETLTPDAARSRRMWPVTKAFTEHQQWQLDRVVADLLRGPGSVALVKTNRRVTVWRGPRLPRSA